MNAQLRPRLIGLVLLGATFAAGLFSGAALERRANASPAPAAAQGKGQPSSAEREGRRPHRHKHIIDQIELSAEQRVEIDSILQAGRERMNAFWKETRPKYRSLVESTREEIRAVMNEEQRSRYDELLAAQREARSRNGRRGGEQAAERDGGT